MPPWPNHVFIPYPPGVQYKTCVKCGRKKDHAVHKPLPATEARGPKS